MQTPADLWILDDGLVMGGGQRFALRLAEVVRDRGGHACLVAPARSPVGLAARDAGFDVVDVCYPRLVPPAVWAMPRAVRRLRRALAAAPPNALVVGNTARCQAYATAAMATMPQPPAFVHLMQEQDSAHRVSARAVYRHTGALVAVGENAAAAYRRRLPEVEVVRANNFLSRPHMEQLVAARTPAPGGSRPVLGMLARMIPEKGVLALVEELASIPEAWETLRIGAPEQDRAYGRLVRERIAELGLESRVRLLGEVHDLGAFFAGVDALVVPSTGNEGQPTVILESLLYGRPVVLRHTVWSPVFDELPVTAYRTTAELAAALAALPEQPATVDELQEHFGAPQVLDRLMDAAHRSRHGVVARRPAELDRPIGGHRADGGEWSRHIMRHRVVTPRGAPVPTAGSYIAFAEGLPRVLGLRRDGRRFDFDGDRYPYLYHRYNNTWLNERAVEVPIAARMLERHRGRPTLEIGNVLAHYGHDGHEVVDKYEQAPGVRNIDVLDLEPERRWDLILSISTLEHVGVDDAPEDPLRGAEAARLLAERVAPGGEMLITVPVGYNPALDEALVSGDLAGFELFALRRTGAGPRWAPTEPEAVVGLGYDWRNSTARAVLVARYRRPA